MQQVEAKFSAEDILREFAKCVDKRKISKFMKSTPDHHFYEWNYIAALIDPLEVFAFPQKDLEDLGFALGEVLGEIDCRQKGLDWCDRIYLVSLYLYIRQVRSLGYSESSAVRIALKWLLASSDAEWIRLYGMFLKSLVSVAEKDPETETYFLRVGVLVCRSHRHEIDESEILAVKKSVPDRVRGPDDLKVLAAEATFPQSWEPILAKVRSREAIEGLLGL